MERRALLIDAVAKGMFPGAALGFAQSFRAFLEGVEPGAWDRIVPVTTPTSTLALIGIVVDAAILEGWVRKIFDGIPRTPINKDVLDLIQAELDDITQPTIDDPVKEVLLEGTRPFAGREELRAALKELFRSGGSTLIRINGSEKTGKTFSFYLAQHVARQSGYIASQFDLGITPDPQSLATDVIGRVGASLDTTKATGLESSQRSIGKEFADQVKTAIDAQKQKRLFVFDSFPGPTKPDLPPETMSFIVRLAQYADAELRPLLRVVLIGFTGEITDAIDDVAEHDEAQGFTAAEMLDVLMQIAKARHWDVTEAKWREEIEVIKSKPLRQRFLFMRDAIRRLARPPAGGTQ